MIYISDITSRNTLDNTPINKNKRAAAVCTREDNAHIPPLLMTGLQTHLSVYLQGYSTYIYKVLQVQPSAMQQMELGHINSSTHNYSFIVSLKNQLQGVPTITDWNVREHRNKPHQRAQVRAELNCMKS